MGLILQIETATTVCSVALALDGKLIGLKEINERNVHAELITLFIQDVLAQTNRSISEIDAVAVSKGPGSYTGLRIGVSTAKGLCFALDKPLIAINTLEAMASGAMAFRSQFNANTLLCPMIDARRMEVYTTLIDLDGKIIKPTIAEIIGENTFASIPPQQQIVLLGDGAEKCREVLLRQQNIVFLSEFNNSASQLNELAREKFNKNDFEDIAYFEPFYLKEFIAGKKTVS